MAKSGVEPVRIHTVVFHHRPHLDEIFAWFMALTCGEERFPGVAKAKYEFWGGGGVTPDGQPVEEWEKEGYLVIGTGGSRFDEHPARHNGTTAHTSSAQLMAEFLGISHRKELGQLLKYVNRIDSQGGGSFMELANLITVMYQSLMPEFVIKWAHIPIAAHINDQREFFETEEGFARKANWLTVPGSTLRVAAIESDNRLIHKASRHSGCDVLIQGKSTGHVQIFVDKRVLNRVNLPAVAMALRWNECVGRGVTVNCADIKGEEGLQHGWYLQSGAGWIFNGSDTASDVPATAQKFENVCELVVRNIQHG